MNTWGIPMREKIMKTTHKFVDYTGAATSLPPWKERKILEVVSVTYLPGTGDPDDPDDVEELEFTYRLVDEGSSKDEV